MADNKQPKVKKGTTFNGWAISNWGILLPHVYRTRKEAMASAINSCVNDGKYFDGTWKGKLGASRNHRLVKVKVTVI